MDLPTSKVSDILLQKVQDIQSRLPIKMSLPGSLSESFSKVLEETTLAASMDSESLSTGNSLVSPDKLIETTITNSLGNNSAGLFPDSQTSNESNLYENLINGLNTSKSVNANSINQAASITNDSISWPRLNSEQLQRIMPQIDMAIHNEATKTGIDPKLLRAIIKQESSFQPFSISKAGAMGLMQLMPGTANDLGVNDPYNIDENIQGGTEYFKQQLDRFNGDLSLALAAYNSGPNAVSDYGGVPPYKETQDFVNKVLTYYNMYRASDI